MVLYFGPGIRKYRKMERAPGFENRVYRNGMLKSLAITAACLITLDQGVKGYFKSVDIFSPRIVREKNTAIAQRMSPILMENVEHYMGIKFYEAPGFNPEPSEDVLRWANDHKFPAIYSENNNEISFLGGSVKQHLTFGLFGAPMKEIRDYTAHELMHAWIDQYREHHGIEFEKTVGRRIVDDGIATYLQKKLNPNLLKGICPAFPVNGNDPRWNIEKNDYIWGLQVVAPIIEQYGTKGLEFLIEHPIPNDQLTNMLGYVQNSLEALGGDLSVSQQLEFRSAD